VALTPSEKVPTSATVLGLVQKGRFSGGNTDFSRREVFVSTGWKRYQFTANLVTLFVVGLSNELQVLFSTSSN
jgi:hypothetical protein